MNVRLKDVAKEAGVAVNTVSSILNSRKDSWASEETKQRVRDAAKKLGYVPNRMARGLILGKFNTIGLIIPDLQNPFYSALITEIETELIKRNYELIIEDTRLDFKRERLCLERIKGRQVDGIIINPINPAIFKTHLEPLAKSGTPVVVLGGPPENSSLCSVQVDLNSSINDAFRHLAELGHKKIGFILHKLAPQETAAPRTARFREAMNEHNLESPKEFLIQCEPTMEAAFEVFADLIASHPKKNLPTAFVCMNDLLAMGAMRAARDAKLAIPDDIAFVGVDDIPAARMLPISLTTISQPVHEMAVHVIEAVLEEKSARKKTILNGQLIVRESTGTAHR